MHAVLSDNDVYDDGSNNNDDKKAVGMLYFVCGEFLGTAVEEVTFGVCSGGLLDVFRTRIPLETVRCETSLVQWRITAVIKKKGKAGNEGNTIPYTRAYPYTNINQCKENNETTIRRMDSEHDD